MSIQQPIKMRGGVKKTLPIVISDFKGGVNSYLDEARLPNNTLRTAINYMLSQDGVLTPRWGTKTYGHVFDSMPDGIDTFTDDTGGTLMEYQIAVIGGVTYKAANGGAWTAIPGATLTPGYEVSFLQIDDKVYMANGHDKLAYYDITANTVLVFSGISAPAAPTGARSSTLSSGSYNNFYKISAVNEVGETIASAETNVTTNRLRDQWRNTDTNQDYIDLSWTAVTGADRYNIYYSDVTGDETYIDSVSSNAYRDSGQSAQNVAVEAPVDDTTGGPILKNIAMSSYRIFGIGVDKRVYWGGVGKYISAFSPFYGGGWVEINKGTGEVPVTVRSYRDGRGDPVNVVFMTTASGEGSQNQLTLTAMTVGTTSFITPEVARVVGSYGTYAANSVVEAENNLFFLSAKGSFTTGAKPDLLNVLSTDEISLAIRPDINTISAQHGSNASAKFFDGKIFHAVPANNATSNNEVWILDMQMKSWIRPWTIGVKKFISYTPSSDGRERLMALLNTPDADGKYHVVEFNEKYLSDDGVPFTSSFRTSLIHLDKSHINWGKLTKSYAELLRMSGSLSLSVSGTGKKKSLRSLKSIAITASLATSGYSTERFSQIRYSRPATVPVTYSDASIKKVIKVNKVINNFRLEGRSVGASYGLATLTTIIVPKRVPDPSSWKH